MICLEFLKDWSKGLISGQYLPITVSVAIALFLLKEVLEIRRRFLERKRKTNAAKLLLSQELEKNHWALVSFFRVLQEIKDAQTSAPNAIFRLQVARDGSEHYRVKEEPEDQDESGGWIATFRTDTYEKQLATLAEYDQKLYEIINETYDEIFELIHYRETLTQFLAGEAMAPDDMTQHFLADLATEKDDYYNEINKGYRALTGKDLKEWRLR